MNVDNTIVGEDTGSVGTFVHTNGNNIVGGNLAVGVNNGEGSYSLSGDESVLAVFNEYIGAGGDEGGGIGSFTQAGGSHTVERTLLVGLGGGRPSGGEQGEGSYELSGSGSLAASNEYIGGAGVGRFVHTGGRHAVSDTLYLGTTSVVIDGVVYTGDAGNGTYLLNAGILTAENERIGDGGTGVFTHLGGTNRVQDTLSVGRSGGNGAYQLSGDTSLLSASTEVIGDGSTGELIQSGGTHQVDETLKIGATGRYVLSGGMLSTREALWNSGDFEQSGGVFSGPEFRNAEDGRFEYRDGAFSAAFVNDGSAIFAPIGHAVFDANIGGNGQMIKQGNGTLVLTGVNTSFGGRTLVSSGVLQGSTDSLQGDITNNARVVFDQATAGTYASNMSGSGSLAKEGSGTVVLTGANSYGGGTNLNGGTLSVSSDDSLGDDDSALSFDGGMLRVTGTSFTYTPRTINWGEGGGGFDIQRATHVFSVDQSLEGEGGLAKLGEGTLVLGGNNSYTGGTMVTSGVLQGNADSLTGDITNNARVVFDQPQTGVFEGTIRGVGNVVKQNAGLLTFNGQNSYSGGTKLFGGNLQIGDAAHSDASIFGLVGVGASGILSGHGSIQGDVDNAGIIAPGGSIGTLTVSGDVVFQSGSTFQIAVDPTESSRLLVGGEASLGGARVNVAASGGNYGPNRYTILSAGSIDGRFRDEILSNFASIDPLLTPSLAYDASNVYLDLDPIPLPDPMGPPGYVAEDLVFMIDRMTTGRFNQAMGELCPASLGFWARGFDMDASASATGDTPGYDGDASGFVLGIDGQVSDRLSIGVAAFYASIDVTTDASFTDRSNADVRGFNLYGAYTNGAWQLRSALGYSNESYTSRQTIVGRAQTRRAGGSTSANRIANYTEGSYTFKSGDSSLQPLLAVQLGWMDQDGFTQEGLFADGQGLHVDGRTQYLFDGLVGARARQDITIGNDIKVQAELRALYMRRFGELDDNVDGTLTGGQSVSLSAQDRPGSRNAGIFGAGITLLTTNGLNLYLDYNGQFSDGRKANSFSAGVRYVW